MSRRGYERAATEAERAVLQRAGFYWCGERGAWIDGGASGRPYSRAHALRVARRDIEREGIGSDGSESTGQKPRG